MPNTLLSGCGKSDIVELLITALISNGHILLEDVPTAIYEKARYSNIECSIEEVQLVKNILKDNVR